MIRRKLDVGALAAPPSAAAADDEGYLDGNRSYRDLRRMSWDDVAQALERERELLARLLRADDIEAEAEAIEEERLETFEDPLFGLDVGVASATLALSAMGCTPVSSCNGGMLGGFHSSTHPVVASYLPAEAAPAALSSAQIVGAGLVLDEAGRAILYAGRVDPMIAFAAEAARRMIRAG